MGGGGGREGGSEREGERERGMMMIIIIYKKMLQRTIYLIQSKGSVPIYPDMLQRVGHSCTQSYTDLHIYLDYATKSGIDQQLPRHATKRIILYSFIL